VFFSSHKVPTNLSQTQQLSYFTITFNFKIKQLLCLTHSCTLYVCKLQTRTDRHGDGADSLGVWQLHCTACRWHHVETHSITNSMQEGPSWESDSFLATQEILPTLCNQKVHYRVHKSHHLSLSWARSIQSAPLQPISLRSVRNISSHLRVGLPSELFRWGFPTKTLYEFLFSPICCTSLDLFCLDLVAFLFST